MLAHDKIGGALANIFRAHDLIGLGVLQHAILMDAAFMRKGILADNCFIVLDWEARDAADHFGSHHQACRIHNR